MQAFQQVAAPAITCPLCGNSGFEEVNGRPNAGCRSCLSLERTRLLFLVLMKMNIFRPGMKVMHIAPEHGLRYALHNLYKEDYHACDFSIERFGNELSPIYPIDLCNDIERFPSNTFDVIIHNHVLEHLPAKLDNVLAQLQRILKADGYHFFTIPMIEGYTIEDIHEANPAVRAQRFGQDDHYRVFGMEDTIGSIRKWTGAQVTVINVSDYLTEQEVIEAGIPIDQAFAEIGPSIPFLIRK